MTVNWDAIAAVGQLGGAVAAAIAAWIAYGTVQTAKRVAETAIEAELLKDYAGPEMHKALVYFGDFAHDEQHKERLKRMRDYYFASRPRNSTPDTETMGDFAWAKRQLEGDTVLSAARRQIHHYFKRIWALHRIRGISKEHLPALTDAQRICAVA